MLFKSYRIGVTLAAGAFLLVGFTSAGQNLEGLLLHLGSRLIPMQVNETPVAVVAIDEETLAEHGGWPWPRDRLADVIDRLADFKPANIGLVLSFDEAETAGGVAAIKQNIESLAPGLQADARKWLAKLDTDARLAASLAAAGNVVLTASYDTRRKSGQPSNTLSAFELKAVNEALPWYEYVRRQLQALKTLPSFEVVAPVENIAGHAAAIGLAPGYANGAWVHGQSLAVDVEGRYLPGLELVLWAAGNEVDVSEIEVFPGASMQTVMGTEIGSVDRAFYPRPATDLPVYSLGEIMRSDTLARELDGKILLLGVTAGNTAPVLIGPGNVRYTPVVWSAHVLAGMLADNGFSMPEWFYAAQRLLIVLFALYLLFIPMSWHGPRGLLAALALSAVVINTGLIALIVENTWLPVISPVMFLAVVQMTLFISWRRGDGLASVRRELVDTRVALATQLQSQGQLDQAMEQYLQCLPDNSVLQPLYELGLEYERHRQVGKAQVIYEKLLACTRGFRDTKQRCSRLNTLSDRFPSTNSTSPTKTLVLDAPVLERPVLGRYRVERELGQGAMGTVYLATDPTIGREVAIKTLPLLQHFEGPEKAAVAERFFQEAEAVGRLNHPNIVTVYDAGKEHDLAYIAMDYVPGASLDQYTAKADLLPVWEVLEIAAQIASALDYAHRRNVVHRDIKPGNIMYDRDSGIAKIADFGIARLLDTSRTRTGTILGSPSYMSPEQVAGKKTDGRSDLFSLGVTLYQLLSGSLPFRGDTVATLMYQIANRKTPAIRKLRSDLPISISRLINKSLQKNPASRFASGEAMAEAIRKCRGQFRGGRKKTA